MEKIIKISLSVLLLGCLLKMPYGYYQLVRFLCFVVFSFLAYQAYSKKKETSIFYAAIALLFQPFFKIALGRELWNFMDVVAIGLILSISKVKKNE